MHLKQQTKDQIIKAHVRLTYNALDSKKCTKIHLVFVLP